MVDDNNDLDIDVQEDFEQDKAARPSLKETWDSNPVLKVAAIALGGALLIGGYMTFFGGDEKGPDAAIVGRQDMRGVAATPGSQVQDEVYTKAIEKQNEQRVDEAQQTGGSAMPTPVGPSSQSSLDVPEAPEASSDPLTAWRREAESRRLAMEQKVVEEEEAAPQPEVVPMVQPIRPQQVAKVDPNVSKALAAQMRTIIAAQAPRPSQLAKVTNIKSAFVIQQEELEKQKAEQEKLAAQNATGVDENGNPIADAKDKVIVPAGSIVYAQLMNELNSDLPGPVLAHVLSGPFAGGRALGTLAMKDEYLTLTFNQFVKDGVVYKTDGIALDEETTLPGHQTEVDHHYFTRVILPAAAEFIQGYASAVRETGTSTTTTDGGGVATEEPEPDETEELLAGVEKGADRVSQILDQNSQRPITVHVAKGTTMGILVMDSISTKDAN